MIPLRSITGMTFINMKALLMPENAHMTPSMFIRETNVYQLSHELTFEQSIQKQYPLKPESKLTLPAPSLSFHTEWRVWSSELEGPNAHKSIG